MKPALLFLCHRIPYPPNKGDKIRSWHLLQHLCKDYRVYLGTFVDDPDDWQHVQVLENLCEECCLLPLNPKRARARSLRAFITGQPLTLPYYYQSKMDRWIQEIVTTHGIERLVAYSSSMAQYALHVDHNFVKKMIDFVDIDSDKWLQYAENKSWPMSWLYRREARELHRFEQRVTEYFDASLFVSSAEAELFRTMMPEAGRKIDYFNNGVDTNYFSPDNNHQDPYPKGEKVIVFTGAMDYWPNIDAVEWFANEVFVDLHARYPQLRFYVVGSNPAPRVQTLNDIPGVTVTGTVPDIRPYLQYAMAAIAPMRIARGVQNKVLEAMAMARPVLVSPMGLEGIQAEAGSEILLADTPKEYKQHVQSLLETRSACTGMAGRVRVIDDFSWKDNLAQISELLEHGDFHGKETAGNV